MTFELKLLPSDEAQWEQRGVFRLSGPLSELVAKLPTFTRRPFTYEEALNEYLDLILRDPHGDDPRLVPVATVSQRYALIQHRDAASWIVRAFEEMQWPTQDLLVRAWISEYGERLKVEVPIPREFVEPRPEDRIAPTVYLWNSVDRSRAFEVAIGWLRLVCSNGLALWEGDRLRKIHHKDWMSSASPVEFLKERLPLSRKLTLTVADWVNVPVDARTVMQWVDHQVAKQWSKVQAARVLHIVRTGHDCAVGRSREELPASRLHTTQRGHVAGQPERASTAYDVYQALLWVARTNRDIDKGEEMAQQALKLMEALVPKQRWPHD